MLRQSRARILASLTAVVVVLMSAAFAFVRNAGTDGAGTPRPPEASPERPATGTTADKARRAFSRLGCAGCHALEGVGDPGIPLDGIGGRMDRASIRDWAVGAGAATDQLPAGIVRRKARALDDPELESLIDYLATGGS